MRQFRVIAALCALFVCLPATATVTIQAPLYDINGMQSTIGFMRVELVNCGFNVPMVPKNQFALLHSRLDLQPGQQATIYGNDEISCGGVASSLYHITMFTDSGTAEPGDYNYQILAGPAVWSPSNANPWSGALPAPGWQEIYANPTANQTLVQPPGTTLYFLGQIDFTGATVTGLNPTNPYVLPPAQTATLGGVKGNGGSLTCGANAIQNGFNSDGSISCIPAPQTGGSGLCAVSSTLIVNANRLNNVDTLSFATSSPPLNTGCQFNVTGVSDSSFNGGPFTATSVVQQGTQFVVGFAQTGANTNTPGTGGSMSTTGVYNLYPLSPTTLGAVQGANGSNSCPTGQVSQGFDVNGVLQCTSIGQAANAVSLVPAGTQAVAQPVISGQLSRLNANNIEGVLYGDQFNFTPFTPSAPATLVPGLNTLTLAVAPPGVNGADTYANFTPHWLQITAAAGDTSPSEAVPIAGGTCVQGATNCTLIVYVAFSHTAGYKIGSGTAGNQEAERSFAGPSGVIVPQVHPADTGASPSVMTAPFFISHNGLTFRGDGSNLQENSYSTAINVGDTYTQWGNSGQWTTNNIDRVRIQPGLPKFDLVQGVGITSPASINPGDGARVPIASITVSSGTATVEFANNRSGGTHPFSTGNNIYIYSPSNWALTGTYSITVLNNHQFTFPTTAPSGVNFDSAFASLPVTVTVNGACPSNLVAGSVLHSILWVGGTYNGMLMPPYGLGEWAETVGGTCAPGVNNGTIQIVSATPGLTAFVGHSAGWWISGGVQTAIDDNSQGTTITKPTFGKTVTNATFGVLESIDNDQNATADGFEFISQPVRCDSHFCSKGLYGPGPYSLNAGVVHVTHWDGSFQCGGNPVEWFDGNDIDISDSILQGWGQQAIILSKTRGGFGNAHLQSLHEEGGCGNPLGNIGSGDQVWGFPVSRTGPGGWNGAWADWTPSGTSGQAQTWYYLVDKWSPGGHSTAIPIGSAHVNDPSLSTCGGGGVSSCNVTMTFIAPWGDGSAPVQTDILRVTGTSGTQPAAPTGTGTYLVGSITNYASSCNSIGVCTFVDNVANSALQSYTVRGLSGGQTSTIYGPMLAYFPGEPVLTASSNGGEGAIPSYSGLSGCPNTDTTSGWPINGVAVFTELQGSNGTTCPPPGQSRGIQNFTNPVVNEAAVPGLTFQNISNYLGGDSTTNLTGRVNFGGGYLGHSMDEITLWDSNQPATDAGSPSSPGAAGRRVLQPNDVGIGTDMADPGASYMMQHAGNGINLYIGTAPSNSTDSPTGWLYSFQANSLASYKPFNLLSNGTQTYQSQGPELTTPTTNPPAGFQRGYYKAGAGWCSINSAGTEFCPGSGGSVSPLTTKGDLYTFSTVNNRLPVGADGQYLVADSTQTNGIKWFTAPTGLSSPLTTKGDIWVYNGTTNARQPVGADGLCLMADSTQATGLNFKTCVTGLATVATSGQYNDLLGKPTLATVATSGSYTDLINKPAFATVATSGLFSDLAGKPNYVNGTDTLTITNINATTINVTGAYQLQSSWPGSPLAVSPGSKTNIGINNDGQLAASVSGDGPYDFARKNGTFTAGNQVTTNGAGQLVDSGVAVGGGGGGTAPIQQIQQNGTNVAPLSSAINFVQGGNIVITSPSAGQISIASTAGNVTGPASSVSGDLPSYNGTSGTTIADTGILATTVTTNTTNGTTNALPKWAAAHRITNSAISDNGTLVSTSEPIDLTNLTLGTEVANNASTGTTLNKLAKLTGAPSTAILTAITDTSGIVGIVIAGNGTAGNALIAQDGQASCVFDGATTAGDYVQNSPTTAGDCHDAGATLPTAGQVLGQVLSTNASAGTYAVLVSTGAQGNSGGTFADPGGTGLLAETAAGVFTNRALTGTTNRIAVSNGNGVAAAPQINIATTLDLTTNTSTAVFTSGALASIPGTCNALKDYYNATDQTVGKLRRCNAAGTGWDIVDQNAGGNTTSTALTSGYLAQASGANSIVNSSVDVGVSAANTVTVASTNGVSAAKFATSGINGGINGPEGTCATLTPGSGIDLLCPNSTAHAWQVNNNNGGYQTLLSGSGTFSQGQSVTANGGGTLISSLRRGIDCSAFASAGDWSQALVACEAAWPGPAIYDMSAFTGAQTISVQPWSMTTTQGAVDFGCGVTLSSNITLNHPSFLALRGCQTDAVPQGSSVSKNGTLIIASGTFPTGSLKPLYCDGGNGTNVDANGCAGASSPGNFQAPVTNITFDCAGKANCEPVVKNNSQEGSYMRAVKARNFQGRGISIANPDGTACTHCQNFLAEELYAQEQGDFCTPNTVALYVNATAGPVEINKGTYTLTNCTTTAPTGGVVRVSGQAIQLNAPHVETESTPIAGTTDGIVIGGDSASSNIQITDAYFANFTSTETCETISNGNTNSFITLNGIQGCSNSGATNLLKDQTTNTGTLTAAAYPNGGFYATGKSGQNIVISNFAMFSPQVTEVANAASTGTTVNKLAKLTGAPSTAVITAITDVGGAVGIVQGGAGTTGNALIATDGQALCVFDNTTVAGDYVQISSTTAGDCHDNGASYPGTGQVVGRVLASGAAGTYQVLVFGPEVKGGTGGGGGVTGPGSSTNNDVAAFSGTGGGTLLDSGILYTNLVSSTSTLTANAPLIGNGSKTVAVGTASGNTTTFATTTGTLTSGDLASIDASGNLKDSALVVANTPQLAYNTASSTTTTNIAATNMVASTSAKHDYTFAWSISLTTAGTGCTGSTTVVLNAVFTDPNASSSTTQALGTITLANSGNGTVGFIASGVDNILAKTGTAVQYSTTSYTAGSGCSVNPTYQVSPTLVQLW